MSITGKLAELKDRRKRYFEMAKAFCDSQDPHGIMDAGAELQAIDRAIKEIEQLLS